jgi:DNA-binding transcriptional LysR family regulator
VPAAQQLLDSADALQERTGRRRTKPVGRVRLSVPVPLGLYFSSKLNSLLKKHDELSIDLILHDRLRDLIEEGIDLQVCVGEVNDSALISRRIGATAAFLVAAPEYLKGRAEPKEPADLQQHDCIIYHRWGRDDVGGSQVPRARCRRPCAADFVPTTPTPFAVPRCTAGASHCCRTYLSLTISAQAGCSS